MNTPQSPQATGAAGFFEGDARELVAALTTIGRLLPQGMSIQVTHPLGEPAIVTVSYPDGTVSTRQFQGGTVH